VERRKLGESGPEVPVVGLGTWQVLDVRGREEEQSRHEVVRAALEEGANLFDSSPDSSPMYGEAERVLGDALRQHGRDNATVATKGWTSNDREAERQIEDSVGYFTIAQGGVLEDPTISQIAERVGRTPAQVVLRWHIQRSDIVFPKSVTPSRMKENLELFDFELGSEGMDAVTALDRGEDGRTGPHPDKFDHVPN
jgi:diketogulonate reductase-like aldo/keto reductase